MRHQHGIAAVGRELAQRAVGDRHLGQHGAALQAEIAGRESLQVGVGHVFETL